MSQERRAGHWQENKRTVKAQRTGHGAHVNRGSKYDKQIARESRLLYKMRRSERLAQLRFEDDDGTEG